MQGEVNMKYSNDEKRIKQMYENIQTPNYDIKRNILNAIESKPTVHKINRKALIAATLFVVLLFVGTAGAMGMFGSFKVFNFPNENTQSGILEQEIIPEPTTIPEGITIISNPDEDQAVYEFTNAAKAGELRAAYYFYEEGSTAGNMIVSPIVVKNYSEMEQYINDGKVAIPLPKYIPSGYTFSSGSINLYLTRSILEIEPSSIVTQNGITYMTYQLPESYEKNIVEYNMVYTNNKGEYLRISPYLNPAFSEQVSSEFGTSDTAIAENVNIPGYGNSLFIHDNEQTWNYLNQLILYNKVEPIETIYFYEKIIDEYVLKVEHVPCVEILNTITIKISTDGLSKREVIKIAENLN